MLKKLCLFLTFLLIFCFCVRLLGDESVSTYFPDTIGSYWVYEDQDGNEFTREAADSKEFPGETYHAFSYEPALEKWSDYIHHFQPSRYRIDENGITFFVSDKIEEAIKARLTKEVETLPILEPLGNSDVSFDVIVDVADKFFALPMPISINEEWDAAKLTATLTVKIDEPDQTGGFDKVVFNFTVFETGNVVDTETVNTPAGTFENCLKIEYRTETELQYQHASSNDNPPGESVTTLWLAPNIGIVKCHRVVEDMILKVVPDDAIPFSTISYTLELKKYEIKSDASKTETDYFPNAPGSYWVYVDKDGNELTRRAVKDEIVPPNTYRSFSYKPTIENWEDYYACIHPSLFQVNQSGIQLYNGDEVEKAVKARLSKEMDTFIQMEKKERENKPNQEIIPVDVNHNITVDSQDHFNVLPTRIALNNNWLASKVKAQIILKYEFKDASIPATPIRNQPPTLNITILERGNVLDTETVETPAGTFEDCLKIEYQTETTMENISQGILTQLPFPPGESVTTLWLAPKVGIVKFHREAEKVILKPIAEAAKGSIFSDALVDMLEFSASTTIKTFKLKKYEIKPSDSESGGSTQ